jgi:hypothetical protein
MRAVQTTGFGGPEVMDVVDLPDPGTWGDHESRTPRSRAGRPSRIPARVGHVIAVCTEETPARVAVFTRRAGHRGRHT